MARRPPRNVSASVFARLKNLRTPEREVNQLLQLYTAERFLYRLSVSPEADNFTLKGATMFLVWCGDALRSTRDVDLARYEFGGPDSLREAFMRIAAQPCPEDGVAFAAEAITMTDLPIDPDLPGRAVRAMLKGTLGSVRLSLQVDVGFDETVTPGRRHEAIPTLLGHPAPVLWTVPREIAVAEKLHAMARFERRYTRVKDIWDVAALALRFAFRGPILRQAVDHAFAQRGTIPTLEIPSPLQPSFYEGDRQHLWRSFRRLSTLWAATPATLSESGRIVRSFLTPVWNSAARGEPFDLFWPPGGPWRKPGESPDGMLDGE